MSKKRKLRQATESALGAVSVLCYACRRTSDSTVQKKLAGFFVAPASSGPGLDSGPCAQPTASSAAAASKSAASGEELLLCSKCRRVMDGGRPVSGGGGSKARVLPQIARLRGYQRLALEQRVPFTIADSEATTLMRQDCELCGVPAPAEGHGLSRLCHWPDDMSRPERGGYMGPFTQSNLIPACATCNLMKGFRRPRGYVEAARHVATHRAGEGDFGRYPHRFRDNISKRSRSCYITASSTHTKTHALSNEAFARIVTQPCRYCGKASDPPRHYNGLDRLDSDCRVYTEESCVACCGDCNVMKYKHSESKFIAHCLRVARHNVGRDEFAGDVEADAAAGHPEPDALAEEAGLSDGLQLHEEDGAGHQNPAIVAWDPEEEEEAPPNPFAAFAHPPPRGEV